VTAAAAKLYPTQKLSDGRRKTGGGGKTFYEAEMKEGQTKRDVVFMADERLKLWKRKSQQRRFTPDRSKASLG